MFSAGFLSYKITNSYALFSNIVNGDKLLQFKVPALDISITRTKLKSSENGGFELVLSTYQKNKTFMNVSLPNKNSSVTYEVRVTSPDDKAYNLSNIIVEENTNENIKYKIEGITVGDKIGAGESKLFLVRFYYDGEVTTNTETSLVLRYEFVNHIETFVAGEYGFSNDYKTFVVPYDGIYKIELWGASGGDEGLYHFKAEGGNGEMTDRSAQFIGGYGGYTSGEIKLRKNDELYVYIGETGKRNLTATFNGGGAGAIGGTGYKGTNLSGDKDLSGFSGGGATDIRLVKGNWDNFDSLKSRIMVAAGGGGSTVDTYSQAGDFSYAGGLFGYNGGYYSGHVYSGTGQNGKGGTQIAGGKAATIHFDAVGETFDGSFGIGGYTTSISSQTGAGGGGGGYYGGSGASGTLSGGSGQGGGGGSSFVSGHDGCNAVSSDSTSNNLIHTGQSVHYSGYKFTNTRIIDGYGYNWTTVKENYVGIPTYDGLGILDKNLGDGYAKITFVERTF